MFKSIFILILLFASITYAESGEARIIQQIKGSPEGAAKIAVTSKNESVSLCVYGMFLKDLDKFDSKLAVETVIDMAAKKGLKGQVIAITSFYDVATLAPKLIEKEKDELAAQLLAAKAYHNIAYDNTDKHIANEEDEGELADKKKGKKKGKGKKKKGKGKKNAKAASTSVSIPDKLFESKSEEAQYMAILAAAYCKQAEYKEKVLAVKDSSGEIMAAKILFMVMTGGEIDDRYIGQAFTKSQMIRKPIKGTPVMLSELNMNVPGMCTLMEALGRTKDKKYLGVVAKALEMKDERVRIDAVRAARRIGDPAITLYILKMVKECEWTVLIEVCKFLGENPVKDSIPHLIKRFEDETGRFRLDVNYALSSIVGEQKGTKPEEWRNWWAKNSRTFKVDPKKSAEFRAKVNLQDVGVPMLSFFYQLGVYSDRCCFVLDYSKSMNKDRLGSLKENMQTTVQALEEYVQFNICDFGGDVNLMYGRGLTDSKKNAEKYFMNAPLTLGTRSMDAIYTSTMIPEVDTLYFLSDGAPVWGQLQVWERIHKMVKLMGRYRAIAISAICFDPSASNEKAMKTIADENYGHHESINF